MKRCSKPQTVGRNDELSRAEAEIKRLRTCIGDLVGVVALPAIWGGDEPSHIVDTVLDVLLSTLRLDFVYARLTTTGSDAPMEMCRITELRDSTIDVHKLCEAIGGWLDDAPRTWPSRARSPFGDGDISMMVQQAGVRGESGLIVAGSRRRDFPTQTEKLLLSVAANQMAIGLQEAHFLWEQKRLASVLEQHVARRTRELAIANEDLRKEIAGRKLVEKRLRLEEMELKRSQRLRDQAQRLSSTGSFTWCLETDEMTWSDESYRIFDIDKDVPLTFALIDNRVHPDDLPMYKEQIARARRRHGDLEFDFRLRLPAVDEGADGGLEPSVRYIHLVARVGRSGGDVEYIGAVQDVTQRRISEQALGEVRSQLAYMSRISTVGALTASIAHEVNQPLSGIITNGELTLHMLADESPDIDAALGAVQRIVRDCNRASDVIARLRALFAKRVPVTEPVDLSAAAREVVALSLNELETNRVVVRTALAKDLAWVTGDRVQLQQVILNLLLNASEAMSGVIGPREVLIRTDWDEDGGVRLSVKDAGVGIEAKNLNNVFRAFYTTKSSGMGIGLFVSRSIIEAHNGRLWAVPNEGPGTTFHFSIPRHAASVHGRMEAAQPTLLVSVVDDDHSIRESLPLLVKSLGFRVKAFPSAEEFLVSTDIDRTRCLLLDIVMPGMSGPDLMRELALRRQNIPTVLMTAQADDAIRLRMLELGAVECLFKPLTERALRDALGAALAAR